MNHFTYTKTADPSTEVAGGGNLGFAHPPLTEALNFHLPDKDKAQATFCRLPWHGVICWAARHGWTQVWMMREIRDK